jgi:predicted PurR-regulated permease PerM
MFAFLTAWLTARFQQHREEADRGDVPGWVMVTVMSAILVVAILAVFGPEIRTAISSALSSVTSSSGSGSGN